METRQSSTQNLLSSHIHFSFDFFLSLIHSTYLWPVLKEEKIIFPLFPLSDFFYFWVESDPGQEQHGIYHSLLDTVPCFHCDDDQALDIVYYIVTLTRLKIKASEGRKRSTNDLVFIKA